MNGSQYVVNKILHTRISLTSKWTNIPQLGNRAPDQGILTRRPRELNFFSCEAQKYGITVWIADYDYYSDDIGEFTVDAEEIIIHPNYSADNIASNNICLLRVPTLSGQKPGFYLNWDLPIFTTDIMKGK